MRQLMRELGRKPTMNNPKPAQIPQTDPFSVFALWSWRLVPLFAAVAVFSVWNARRASGERELAIRSGIVNRATEWAFMQGITGKPL